MTLLVGDVQELNVNSQDVCSFYEQKWERQIALSIFSFYKWQFTSSPLDAGNDHCMVAIDSDSRKVLGVMGLNKRPFVLNGQSVNAAELTTWIVDQDYLGRGIGARILQKIQSKYELLIGMGITSSGKALPLYARSGFRYIAAIPRFIKVFDFDAVAPYAQYTSLAPKLVKRWVNTAIRAPFDEESANEENIQNINDIFCKKFNHYSRDPEHLQWRYTKHPVFEYKQFIIFSKNRGKGTFICLREETNVENLRILHILDFLGDADDMSAAMSFIDNYCVENKFHLVDFYCTATQIIKYFIGSGWFSINDDACFQFPHLFHPIKLRLPPTTSFVYWSRENFTEFADFSKLYITKQDCDFDRPTVETYKRLKKEPN